MKPRLLWLFLLLVGLLLWMPVSAGAQEGEPTDDEVNAIAHQLYFRWQNPLDVCSGLVQWRGTIRQMLREGHTEEEIKDYFVQQYGERVLATPPARGFNWLAYVIPPAAFLGGAIVLAQTMRRWRRPAREEAASPAPQAEDPFIERLEQELRKRA
jgi:cytochrome c-type biogenesis protein CcmH